MAQIANVEYFKNYCNRKLGTSYTWNSKQAINLYWTAYAVIKVYNDIHKPKTGCKHPISTRFNLSESAGKIAVDITFVHTVIDYLYNFRVVCDIDCACPCTTSNCSTHCGTCSQCCNACACVCVCDCECTANCSPYECHSNCAGSNCSNNCVCNCNCCNDCDCSDCSSTCVCDCGDCAHCWDCDSSTCDCPCWG